MSFSSVSATPPRFSGLYASLPSSRQWSEAHARLDAETAHSFEKALANIPPPPRTGMLPLWDAYARTECQKALGAWFRQRMEAISLLSAANAFSCEPRRQQALRAWIEVACAEPTWLGPVLGRDAIQGDDRPVMDVHCAMTGMLLAMTTRIHARWLPESLQELLEANLRQRVLAPFLNGTHWWLGQVPGRRVNNFTPLCCAAALLASFTVRQSSREETAAIIRACDHGLRLYIDTFAPDGGCEEGPSYWAYGMDYFVLAAELLRSLPEPMDLYSHPLMPAMAAYPLAVAIGSDAWTLYSDCRQVTRWSPGTLALLDRRLGLPALSRLARAHRADLSFLAREGTLLTNLLWWPEPGDNILQEAPKQVHFKGCGFFITRPAPEDPSAPVITLCAGDNGRPHNHNDIGHLTYYLHGEPLLTDLGAPEYERDYFSPRRCSYLAASSRGHSVPVVNRRHQGRGPAFRASILEHDSGNSEERIRLDLTEAYPVEAGLHLLERAVRIQKHPQPGLVRLTDHYTLRPDFPEEPEMESALVTTHHVEIAEGRVHIQGRRHGGCLEVTFDPAKLILVEERLPNVALQEESVTVTLLRFRLRQATWQGMIELEIVPIPSKICDPC